MQANKPGSGTLYAHAIVSTELPVCGLRLEVPFGQTMLTEFDRHLRTYGFRLRDRRRDATRVGGGSEHELYSPDTDQARVLNASGVSANVLVRTPTLGSTRGLNSKSVCDRYLTMLRSAYLQWILGEFGLLPKLHVAWIDWRPVARHGLTGGQFFTLSTVVDRFQQLSSVVRSNATGSTRQSRQNETEHGEIAAQLVRNFELLARLQLSGLDRDIVIRRQQPDDELHGRGDRGGGQWDVRLVDLDSWKTFILPKVPVPCLRLMSLQLPTVTMVCGPMQHTPFAKHFARATFHSTLGLPRLNAPCFSPKGRTEHNRALAYYFSKTLSETKDLAIVHRRANGSLAHGGHEAFRIHQMLYDNWLKESTVACPVGWSWG